MYHHDYFFHRQETIITQNLISLLMHYNFVIINMKISTTYQSITFFEKKNKQKNKIKPLICYLKQPNDTQIKILFYLLHQTSKHKVQEIILPVILSIHLQFKFLNMLLNLGVLNLLLVQLTVCFPNGLTENKMCQSDKIRVEFRYFFV